MGIVLVTSQPSGLAFDVDGVEGGVTPARVEQELGSHVVTIHRGGDVVDKRTVDVKMDNVSVVDFVVEAPAPEKGADAEDPAGWDADQPAAVATPEAATKGAPAPESTPTPMAVGELTILSRNLYGEVVVDGRSIGFPPVVAKEVPVGPVLVEIRVDGTTRKTKTVEVKSGKRLTVRL